MFQNNIHWGLSDVALLFLIIVVVLGNTIVILAVLFDRKLKAVTTNKFIASLAVSDLFVGVIVMPMSLYSKLHNDEWTLGYMWCQFHLVTGVFSTTASIVHLVAISLDRYFAIMFPTEYQRHSVSTSTLPYLVMIWVMALAVSSTLFMERKPDDESICWIDNPQYIVRSRRGSKLSQTGSQSGSPTRRSSGSYKNRSPSQPDIHSIAKPPQRWRSPTICAETLAHDRNVAAKKRVSIIPDPPSMDVSVNMSSLAQMKAEHEQNKYAFSNSFFLTFTLT
ncbi:7 transmembrane receptor [Dictyocaulus viviparus]|uniref:7 transmembrane receptor n=1 Tax=Dictyocaulus viviparus TaxID=29172 RepID=A0A0D8YC01_DICVI|nr:7 transmembrane receptor [Dictyocaulus viviparus]